MKTMLTRYYLESYRRMVRRRYLDRIDRVHAWMNLFIIRWNQ